MDDPFANAVSSRLRRVPGEFRKKRLARAVEAAAPSS